MQVTLQLQPLFKRSITNIQSDDFDLESRILLFGLEHEFADVAWYPAQRKAVYRVDDRVPVNTPEDGINDFIGFRPTSTVFLAILREAEEVEELANNAEAKCVLSQIQVAIIFGIGTGLENKDSLFLGYPVIGYQNKMQSAGSCLSSPEDGLETACGWDPRIKGLFYFQNGFSVGLSKIQQFLFDIKKLRDLIPSSLCGIELYYGILMRYVKASSAYLGNQEDAVDLDITYYRAHDPNTPRLYEDVLEEIEQMALVKYGALPHWGKNRNIAFDAVMKKYKKYEAFLAAKNKYDPKGLFSSEWTDGVLGVGEEGVIIKKDGCALEGLCVCSEDAHCSPEKGYFCRPGRVYTEARVCRREGT